jgi:predicted CopG family antitoxin
MTARTTTIACKRTTLKELKTLKRGGQSYDDLINQMISSFDREA